MGLPVMPGTAIMTGSGELARSNGVRHLIHMAEVHGEPGEGTGRLRDVGGYISDALAEVDLLAADADRPRSILFPLLGTGTGGADVRHTVDSLLGAAIDYRNPRLIR